jgi:hypothetical protein
MRSSNAIRALSTSLTLLLMSLMTPHAHAGLLGIDFMNPFLYTINQSTAVQSNPLFTGIGLPDGIAFNASGTLYALGQSAESLFTINPTTGAASLVGSTGLTSIIEGDLAFDPTTGTLYGIQEVDSNTLRGLFTMNTTTGHATILGNVSGPTSDLSAMVFDSSGNLFIVDNTDSLLLRVNKANGAILSSVPLSVQLGSTVGMSIDPATGTFYVGDGASPGTNSLYTLNPTTGGLTRIGTFNLTAELSGLAFTPATSIPEPASAILMGLGIVGLTVVASAARRRRTP